MVFISGGSRGVIALNQANGVASWTANPGVTFNSTPAYDAATNSVFAAATNGTLYKINASNGNVSGTFVSGQNSTLPLPPLLVTGSNFVVFSMGNNVFSVNKSTMAQNWTYAAGSRVDTAPAYSASRNRLFIVSQDLYVHGINFDTGAQAWRVKPTPRDPGSPQGSSANNYAESSYSHPVVADNTGVVLVRYRLDWSSTLWLWSPWPTTNAQMASNLAGNPSQRAIYSLSLDNGSVAFDNNVGHGGFGNGDYILNGPVPVVKTFQDGTQSAYTMIRGSNVPGADGRDDAKFGELILDNSVAVYTPGQVRFIEYGNFGGWSRYGTSYSNVANLPTDEQPSLIMSGNNIFGGHWMVGYGLRIENRSSSYGTYGNPILSSNLPHVVSSTTQPYCNFGNGSHYCSGSVIQNGDTRTFPPNGFAIYYNQAYLYDNYWTAYSSWSVGNNLLIFRSLDGAVIAFESGNPQASINKNQFASIFANETKKIETLDKVINYDETRNFVDYRLKVRGQIAYVINNKKAVYLAFKKPHQGEFMVVIKKEKWNQFPNSKPDEYFRSGETIEVEGVIGKYQGDPVIYLENQSNIKKL